MNIPKFSRYQTLSIIKDFLIIFIIYRYEFSSKFGINPSTLINFCLILYWLLLHYVLGQYDILYKKLDKKFIINLINSLIVFISANTIYLVINIFTDGININILAFYFFIETLFKIIFSLLSIQLIIDFIFIKKSANKNKWIVLSSLEIFEKLAKTNQTSNGLFELIYQEKLIDNIDTSSTRGIIIEKNYPFTKQDLLHVNKIDKKDFIIIEPLLWCEKYLKRCPPELIDLNEFLLISNFASANQSKIKYRVKRLGDLSLSIILILFLTPIFIVVTSFLIIFEGFPIFYSQNRTGLKSKIIKIIKYRTMIINAEKNGPQWSIKNDKRITKIGRILRKFRLDELPQLLNVIKGEMSLIGPRPERPVLEMELMKKIDSYSLRHTIKPGLSGWAQVNYDYVASFDDVLNKLSYDLYYIKNQSLILDFIILFKTIKIVLNGRGSVPKN